MLVILRYLNQHRVLFTPAQSRVGQSHQPAVGAVLDAPQEYFDYQDIPLTYTPPAVNWDPQISFLALHKCNLFHGYSECWCWKNRKKNNQAFNVFKHLYMFPAFVMAGAMSCVASVCQNHGVLIPTLFIQSGLMKKHRVILSPGFAFCTFVFTEIKCRIFLFFSFFSFPNTQDFILWWFFLRSWNLWFKSEFECWKRSPHRWNWYDCTRILSTVVILPRRETESVDKKSIIFYMDVARRKSAQIQNSFY